MKICESAMSAAIKIKIEPEFQDLIPVLSSEEYKMMEESIKKEGCRDPLIVWAGENILVDGHNRYEICKRNKIKYEVRLVEFADDNEVKGWIIDNQLGRRNLSPVDFKMLLGMKYKLAKKDEGGRNDRDLSGGKNYHPKTAEIIATEHGVSEKTVRNAEKFVDDVQALKGKIDKFNPVDHTAKEIAGAAAVVDDKPELAKKILSGEATADQKDRIGKALGMNEHELICAAVLDAGIRLDRAAKQTELHNATDGDYKLMNNALASLIQKCESIINILEENYRKGNHK